MMTESASYDPGEIGHGGLTATGFGGPNAPPHSPDQWPVAMSPACSEEWNVARRRCSILWADGVLGPGSGFGRSLDQCIRGMVSQRCGGNRVV
jgi:hypothetical protein